MSLRAILVVLIVVSTAGFVIGVSIERSSEDDHTQEAAPAETPEAGETSEEHAGEEGAGAGGTSHNESGEEFKPFGIDIEATPFIVLAAAVSLGLAAAAWLRPRLVPLLLIIAAVMAAFAILDVREVLHQNDEDKTGLAVLAAAIGVTHLAAAAVALLMARGAQPPAPSS